MSMFAERADRLSHLLDQRELDVMVVTNIVNVRYLCRFAGTNGICVVGPKNSYLRVFVTDFRYTERARTEVRDWEVVEGRQDLLEDVVAVALGKRSNGAVRIGFEDTSLTVARHRKLSELLPEGAELVAAGGLVERLRAVKDEHELDAIRRATAIADGLYRWLVSEFGLAGHSERAVATALERRAQDEGAEAVAFPPIVAAGANGALPHAAPGDVPIPTGTLVVVDLGCQVDGYCSDCTRTFATGAIDDEAAEVYELVRSAQAGAVSAVRAGADVREVDGAARKLIEEAGHGERFKHGTGHGVGLEVHEAPRIAPSGEGALESGNVVTVEPGVYLPGRFGVRIEDLVVVGEDGRDVLTSVPRELTTVR
jgi:Xaa-Pro aminopeptidase